MGHTPDQCRIKFPHLKKKMQEERDRKRKEAQKKKRSAKLDKGEEAVRESSVVGGARFGKQLDAEFGSAHRDAATQALAVTLRVVYFDAGVGTWALRVGGSDTPVLQVKKTDTKTWLTAAANSSLPAGGGKGVEMSLRSVCYAPACDNEAFSLLEVLVR